jgi:phage-related protein
MNDEPQQAELHFEVDSLEVLSSFPEEIKRRLGFSLRQLQIGRLPTSTTRNMASIGRGVFELKEADERTWYRTIYLSRMRNIIHVLHCFEKASRKTDRRDIEIARSRLKMIRRRMEEQRSHERRSPH